jgi:aspartyl-tRNA(Asn)/glutamyl-tRNA(Gln) amidotransferase subunit C
MATVTFTSDDVSHIATLASIPVTAEEKETLAKGFTTTMGVVEDLKKADTNGIEPTHQVTGLENVWREDVIDGSRTFSQEEALRNAPKTHNGYYVVKQILDK